jgi:hypothetical protein
MVMIDLAVKTVSMEDASARSAARFVELARAGVPPAGVAPSVG